VHEVEEEVAAVRSQMTVRNLCQVRGEWWWRQVLCNMRSALTVALVSIPLSLSLSVAAATSPQAGMSRICCEITRLGHSLTLCHPLLSRYCHSGLGRLGGIAVWLVSLQHHWTNGCAVGSVGRLGASNAYAERSAVAVCCIFAHYRPDLAVELATLCHVYSKQRCPWV
jgi:hypothetical protein